MEHGVKYVQGFAALGTCFARIRTQLFHNHVPPDKAAGKEGEISRYQRAFRLIYLPGEKACSQAC